MKLFEPIGAGAGIGLRRGLSRSIGRASAVGLSALVVLLFACAVSASAATPPFSQCPAVGQATSCNVLITVNGDGTATTDIDASLPPYDGVEDMLVGIQNNSSRAISDVTVSGGGGVEPLFGFDGDGLCSYITCTWSAPTGYEGPITQFVPDINSADQGTIHFTELIPPGGSTYFSLEGEPADSSAATVTPGSTVHPAPSIDPGYWSFGHGHRTGGAVLAPSIPLSRPPGSGSAAGSASGRRVDPCYSKYGSGKSHVYKSKGLFGHRDKHTVYDRNNSLGMVCSGFGGPPNLVVTPAMACGFIAAIGGAVKPAFGVGATVGCEALDPDKTAATMACDWLSVGLGFRSAVAGAVAGVACASAGSVGGWFESVHERDIARDVAHRKKCIVFSERKLGVEWHAERCSWKP